MSFVVLAFAAALASQSSVAAEGQIRTACDATSLNQSTLEHLGTIPTEPWAVTLTDQPPVVSSQFNTGVILGYTRIRIDYRSCPVGSHRSYQDEKRDFLTRKFLGKHLEKSFQLSIKLSPNGVEVSPNLIHLKRDSDSKGESWTSEPDNGNIPTPYFRFDTGSKVLLTPSILSSRDYQSELGSGTIDLITKATAAIVPDVTLITDANKARFNKAAEFVDSTINSLFHVQIVEKARRETALNPGTAGQVLAIYVVRLPFANDVYATKLHAEQVVGIWAVIAEPTRQSMFGEVDNGHLTAANLSPSAILGFSVDSTKTVREALSGAQDVISARDEVVKATDNQVTANKAYRLCRLIRTQAENLALTEIDGSAIAWAYIMDLGFDEAKEAAASAGCRRIGKYPA